MNVHSRKNLSWRRLALVVGLMVFAVSVFWLSSAKTATSTVVLEAPPRGFDEAEWCETHFVLIKSPLIIERALGNLDAKDNPLASVNADPIDWIRSKMKVAMLKSPNARYVRHAVITLASRTVSAENMKQIADAIADEFHREVKYQQTLARK